jgi:multidrug resistance protein
LRASAPAASGGYLEPLRAQPMLVPLMLVMMLVMSGMGVVTPVLSVYAQSFGVGATLIGTTITAFGVARLLVNLPAGIASERFGRRSLLWAGPLVLCLGSIGCALAGSFVELVLWRFVQGVGSGIYMTVATAAAADLSTPATRGRVMALNHTALLAGVSLGPALGGVLADLLGHRAPFWGFAVAAGLACLVALTCFRETRAAERSATTAGGAGGLSGLVTDRRFMAVTAVTFATFFTRTAAQWQLIPLVGHERLGLTLAVVGAALTAHALANLAMLPLAGRLIDRFGQIPCLTMATVLVAVALAVIAAAPEPVMFMAGLMLLGLALGVANPAASAYAADHAPAGRFGPAMGMLRTMGDLGFVLGPILAGAVVDLLPGGYATALAANAALVLAALAAFARVARR